MLKAFPLQHLMEEDEGEGSCYLLPSLIHTHSEGNPSLLDTMLFSAHSYLTPHSNACTHTKAACRG